MKALFRSTAVACLVVAMGGMAQAQTSQGAASSPAPGKVGTTAKSKAKAKAKPAPTDDEPTPGKARAKEKPAPAYTAEGEANVDAPPARKEGPHPAAVTSIHVDELAGFDSYPKKVRSLVASAVALTHLGLTYTYGSSEPSLGGMDCSGTMYHVLRFQGLKDVPRQSDEMCAWVRDRSQLHLTPSAEQFSHAEFDALQPGDLLFWTGTAATSRKLPVTHVMLYLGRLKSTGKRVVFGASDGRSYEGQRRCGVSVFDFDLPRPGGKAAFYGYGPAPGLGAPVAAEEIRKAEVTIAAATTPAPVVPMPPVPATLAKSPAPEPRNAPPAPERPQAKAETAATSTGLPLPAAAPASAAKKKATPPAPKPRPESAAGDSPPSTVAAQKAPAASSSTSSTAAKSKPKPKAATTTPPRKKPAPAKPESGAEQVEKAVHRVVDKIRGVFK